MIKESVVSKKSTGRKGEWGRDFSSFNNPSSSIQAEDNYSDSSDEEA